MAVTKGKEKNSLHTPNNPEQTKNRVQKIDEDKAPGEANTKILPERQKRPALKQRKCKKHNLSICIIERDHIIEHTLM